MDRGQSDNTILTTELLFGQLRSLTKRCNEFEDIPRSQQIECRQIGEQLHAIGGKSVMQEAYYDAKSFNRAASVIAAYWDKVGDWQW